MILRDQEQWGWKKMNIYLVETPKDLHIAQVLHANDFMITPDFKLEYIMHSLYMLFYYICSKAWIFLPCN